MTATNCAFKVKYSPASIKKWKIKAKALRTGLRLAIVTIALAIANTAKTPNEKYKKLTFKFQLLQKTKITKK
jgi:hypothetical protein